MNRLPHVLALSCAIATAQDPAASLGPALIAADDFLVPLHTAPHGGDLTTYGVWAMGRSYKASFHDGFAFYPRPEAGEAVFALRYHLECVSVGAEAVLVVGAASADITPPPRTEWSATHFARHWDGVTEAYDVTPQGVEQTFVLSTAPTREGNLHIVGSVDTALRGPAMTATHAGLVFADPRGRPLVSYGAATAIDAAGRRLPVSTSFDGARLTLTVDGAWLRGAAYPVVVDPLTTRVVLNRSMTFFDRYSEARVTHNPATGETMLVYGLSFGTSDVDLLGYVTSASFTSPVLVFSDIDRSAISRPGNVAFVRGAGKYALCTSRNVAGVTSVQVYLHASGNTSLNSGTVVDLTPATGAQFDFPDLGASDGTRALLVHEMRNAATQEVVGRLIDATAATVGSPFPLSTINAGTHYIRERPTVTAKASPGGSWVTVWQERDRLIANDDFDLNASRVTQAGVVAGVAILGSDASPLHKLHPRVDGANGRYLVAWQEQGSATSSTASQIAAQRFDWDDNAATPIIKPPRVLDSVFPTVPTLALGNVAADTRTASHWALIHSRGNGNEMVITRLGYRASVVETHSYLAQPTTGGFAASFDGPAICFDSTNRRFPFVHTHLEVFLPSGNTAASIYAQHLTYPSTAVNVAYGTNCGGTIGALEPPYVGHEFYAVDLDRAAANTAAVLQIAAAPSAISLALFGMPGCFQNVDPATLLVVLGGSTDATGHMGFTLPVPDSPPTIGDLYFQYAHLAPGANARGLLSTQGLRAQFR